MPNEKDCFSILQSREITLKSVRSDAAWMMEVDKDNFEEYLPKIEESISKADFVGKG